MIIERKRGGRVLAKSLVTVVIPAYNRDKYISQAIDSVFNQTYTHWKLIIVDDASTDNTRGVVSRYENDERVRVISLPHNKGVGHALSVALDNIDTDYFIILDSDDWFMPDTLEILIHEMENQPFSTSLVCGNVIVWEEKNSKLVKRNVLKYRNFDDKYKFMLYPSMLYPRFFRTEAVRQANGFELDDPYQGRYGEDRYLLLKLIARGNFHWVDKELYNLRLHRYNITHRSNIPKFAEVRKFIVTKLLKQWGDEYEPVFGYRGGWLNVIELVSKKNKDIRLSSRGNLNGPKVSVIIPTYNRAYLLKRALDSVLAQTLGDFEIIIVDDGSTDQTEEMVKSYKDSRIHYRKHPSNKGQSAAIQTGVFESRGEYIAFLDSDDEWQPKKLEKQLRFIEALPRKEMIVAYTQVVLDNGRIRKIFPERVKKRKEKLGEYLFVRRGLMQCSTLLMSRSLLMKVISLCNPRRHHDWDLCLRLEKQGALFKFLKEPLTIWHADRRRDRISNNIDPHVSLEWINVHKNHISEKAYLTFIDRFIKPHISTDQDD